MSQTCHKIYMGKELIKVYIDKKREKSGFSKWVVEINIGKRQRKYFKHRTEAYDYKREFLLPLTQGTSEKSSAENIRVSAILKMHIQKLHNRGARPHTIESRKVKCLSFIKRMNDPRLSKISRQDLKEYILQYGQTESTRKSIRSEVGAMLNWAFENDYTSTNFYKVTWEQNFKDEKLIGILTPDESKELMDAMPDAYKCAMALALFAGIRPMEIPRIKWKNIYLDKKLIIIEGEQSKTRRNRKLTDLPDNLIKWIKDFKSKCGYILGGSAKYDHAIVQKFYNDGHTKKQTMEHFNISSSGTLDYLLKKKSYGKFIPFDGPVNTYRSFADARQEACEKCGILYPHDGARHSFGTYGYFVGGQSWAMRCMGHSNETTYKQYYLNTGVGAEEAKEFFSV